MSPRRGKVRRGQKSLFKEMIAEIFSNLVRCLDIQVHEALVSPRDTTKRQFFKDIITKLSKIKYKEFKRH